MTEPKCCGFYSPCRMPDCVPEMATPRTDAVQREMSASGRIDGMDAISAIHLCRQLERELAARPEEKEPAAWLWRCKPYCEWPKWSVSIKRPIDAGHLDRPRTKGYEDIPLFASSPLAAPVVETTTTESPKERLARF